MLNVIEYLQWAVGKGHAIPDLPPSRAPAAGDTTSAEARARARAAAGLRAEERQLIVVLDWFAPHLHERVDEELEKSGAAVLRIAGGLTNDVQVCDTHRHGPLTSVYRSFEAKDSEAQLRVRPHQPMPCFSKQHVVDRSLQAWAQTSTGVDGRLEWVQNACLNALDGTEDGKLGRDLMALWDHLEMPRIRDQVREEIKDEVQGGSLHSFWQYPELLESYDEHAGLCEGMEGAERLLHADGESDSSEEEEEAEDLRQERMDMEDVCEGAEPAPAVPPEVGAEAEACEAVVEAACEPVVGPTAEAEVEARASAAGDPGDPAGALAIVPPDLLERASANFKKQHGQQEKLMKALCEAASLLRLVNDTATAQSLEDRAHRLSKTLSSVDNATRMHLAARTMQRTEQARREQEAAATEDARIKELNAQWRLAKETTATMRAAATGGAAAARMKKLEVEAQHKSAKERLENKKANLLYIQQQLAAQLVEDARLLLHDRTHGVARAAAIKLQGDNYRKGKCSSKVVREIVDVAWDASVRTGYTMVTPAVDAKTKKKAKEWASERMARALFDGRVPAEAKSAQSVASRLNALFEEIAPGYSKICAGLHLGTALLTRNNGNVDLCVITALRRYCVALPAETFLCAIRNWPWSEDQINEWVIAHKERSLRDEPRRAEKRSAREMADAPVAETRRRLKSPPLATEAASSASSVARPLVVSCASSSSAPPPVVAAARKSSAGRPPAAAAGTEILYSKWDEPP